MAHRAVVLKYAAGRWYGMIMTDFWLQYGLDHNIQYIYIYIGCVWHTAGMHLTRVIVSLAPPSLNDHCGVFGYFRYQSCEFPAKRCHHAILLAVARFSSLQHHLHCQQSHQEFFSEWGNLIKKKVPILCISSCRHIKYRLLLLFTSILIVWFWQAVYAYQCVAPTPF